MKFLILGFISLSSTYLSSAQSKSVQKKGTGENPVSSWITTGDKSKLLLKQTPVHFTASAGERMSILVDEMKSYQTMGGFGFALTGGSAMLLNRYNDGKNDALLKELFSPSGSGIGISYLRISIGASDLSASVFTYDETAGDTGLRHFTLAEDTVDLIPLLKKILVINPRIKIMGSPWTAPTWMKTNQSSAGGSLAVAYYRTYAQYFVKYIRAMAKKGIRIDAITPQNEPLNPNNNPSMLMYAGEQADFIGKYLGPAFSRAGIKTKILVYDHNCDKPSYPDSVLADQTAYRYVDGSAFHLYGGDIDTLSVVHNAFPEKNVYFTEQWVGGPENFANELSWHIKNLIIGAPRNWSKNVLEWNLASDPEYNPHTPGGCTTCLGALTISKTVHRNVGYYLVAHASKFVPSGSVRIASSQTDSLPNVAFRTPSGKRVMILLNESKQTQNLNIRTGNRYAPVSIPAAAVVTYTW